MTRVTRSSRNQGSGQPLDTAATSKKNKSSREKTVEDFQQAIITSHQEPTGALKAIIAQGIPPAPPGFALSAQISVEPPIGQQTNTQPAVLPQTPFRGNAIPLAETPVAQRTAGPMRTVNFKIFPGSSSDSEIVSVRVPVYYQETEHVYEIGTREALKLLVEVHETLKERKGVVFLMENNNRFRLGVGSKLISDEHYKPLDVPATAWLPLRREMNDERFWITLIWGIQDESNRVLVKEPSPMDTSDQDSSDPSVVLIDPGQSTTSQQPNAEIAEIIQYLCERFDVPQIRQLPARDVVARHALIRWRVLQAARDQMEELGWLKPGSKNMYVMGRDTPFPKTVLKPQELGALVGISSTTFSTQQKLWTDAQRFPEFWENGNVDGNLLPKHGNVLVGAFDKEVKRKVAAQKSGGHPIPIYDMSSMHGVSRKGKEKEKDKGKGKEKEHRSKKRKEREVELTSSGLDD